MRGKIKARIVILSEAKNLVLNLDVGNKYQAWVYKLGISSMVHERRDSSLRMTRDGRSAS